MFMKQTLIHIINTCLGCPYLVRPLNVACAMAFSKCDCFRFMVFLASEGILMCQKYSLFYKMIINVESNVQDFNYSEFVYIGSA